MKMFNIVVKGQGVSLGLEARSKAKAIEQIILQYQDLWQIKITEKDILEIYQVIPRKYKGQ
jgi:hypothetical protein